MTDPTKIDDIENGIGNFLDDLPGSVWTADPDGNVDYVSRRWFDYTGIETAAALGTGWHEAVHPEDLPDLLEFWQNLRTSNKPGEITARMRRVDGVYRWSLFRVCARTDSEGRVVKWLGISTDIDDLKHAHESLSAESNFRRLVDIIPVPVAVTTPDGEVETLNQATLDYFGRSLNDLKGWKASDVVHPDDLENTVAAQMGAHQTGSTYDVESRHRRSDGVYRWFNVLGLPLYNADGTILRWFHLQIDIEDRKRAEEALQTRERDLSQIINTIPALAWSARADGSAEFLNQHYLEFVGLTREESIDWDWTEALHPDDRKRVLKAWEISLARGKGGEVEARFRRHDGVYRWFLVGVNPLCDESGEVIKWYGQNTDITELKLALEKLQANQDLLDLAQKSARAMAFDWYIQEGVNTWSPAQEALHGFETGTFDGRFETWKSMIHPNDWPSVVQAVKRAHETGNITAEYRVLWHDGSTHWLSANGQMFFDEESKPFRMVGFTTDITARKLIEEDLKRSEAFLAEGQRLSQTGSFLWYPDTDEIIFSEESRRIFGFSADEALNMKMLGSRVYVEDRPVMNELIETARLEGLDQDFENRLEMPDGTLKYIHTFAHGALNKDGRIEYFGAIQDITERRLAEEVLGELRQELAHVSRVTSLGAMTASIAHEVSQPLSGILTNASTCMRMLGAEPPNVAGAMETVRRTIRDANRASDVIARLRALFRKTKTTIEPVDLNEAAREVLALSISDLKKNRVLLESQLDDMAPLVEGDRVQLQQVMLNLVRNASDSMITVEDRPRNMLIKTSLEDDHVLLSVRDSGTGFDAQISEKLFQGFYTTKSDGMGIGLSVSRSIIENHRGRIWAELNDGPGATFYFSVPCSVEDPGIAPYTEKTQTHDTKNNERYITRNA